MKGVTPGIPMQSKLSARMAVVEIDQSLGGKFVNVPS
jgi:hypothetical protein